MGNQSKGSSARAGDGLWTIRPSWKITVVGRFSRVKGFIFGVVGTRVLRPYLQHVESVADEMELRRRELRLYANTGAVAPRWASAPVTHPATLDTVAMDPELKTRVRSDLESFVKGRAYYHRLGRV